MTTPKPESKRRLQVASFIQEQVAIMLVAGKISDPRLKNITIQAVKMSPDLQVAKIFYTSRENQDAAKHGFEKAKGFIRKSLGELLSMRYTPHLVFEYDTTYQQGLNILEVLSKITP